MKIRDLIKETGVPRQTIHYYIQTGLLPKPKKLGKNSAEYNQAHIDRIHLIKELQESYYLPLSVIKMIFKKYMKKPEQQSLLKFKGEFFRPLERLMDGLIIGEDKFMEATGLTPERLADYEEWEIITPDIIEDKKVYSYDDQIIARIIARMKTIGLSSEKGFPPGILKQQKEKFQEIVEDARAYFFEAAGKTMELEEMSEVGSLALENTALFFYHLYHKLAKQDLERTMKELKKERDSNVHEDSTGNRAA